MDESALQAIVGGLGALILASQVVVMRRQGKLIEVAALHEIRSEWASLRPAWHVTLAIGGSMYLDLDDSVVARYQSASQLQAAYEGASSHFDRMSLFASGPPSPDLNQPLRDVFDFLSMVASLVLRRRLTVGLAYEAIGLHVVRNAGAIRRILDEERADFILYYPSVERRVKVLIDLLWIEAARVGDVTEDEVKGIGQLKWSSTGRRSRRRAFEEARSASTSLSALRFGWYLTRAEVGHRSLCLKPLSRLWRFAGTWRRPPPSPQPTQRLPPGPLPHI